MLRAQPGAAAGCSRSARRRPRRRRVGDELLPRCGSAARSGTSRSPLDAATHPGLPRPRLLSVLELQNEEECGARRARRPCSGSRTRSPAPILVGKLGWARPRAAAALGAAARAARAESALARRRRRAARALRRGRRGASTSARAPGWGDHVVRSAAYLNWRFADSPRPYRILAARRGGRLAGWAVVTHKRFQGRAVGRRRRPRRAGRPRPRARCSAAPRAPSAGRRSSRSSAGGARPLPRGRLRADAQDDPLHRQAARAGRRARGRPRRPALRARRPRLLLTCAGSSSSRRASTRTIPCSRATVPKIRALAARVDEVVVLAAARGVRRAAGERPRPRVRRARRGSAAAALRSARSSRELRAGPDAVVAHMIPLYAILAAPLARPRRRPLVLWFTHWNATRMLARRRARRRRGRHRRPALVPAPLGEGARDRARDRPRRLPVPGRERAPNGALRLLALGRYSPAKGLDVVCAACAGALDAGLDVRLTAHGPTANELEREHRAELARPRRRARARRAACGSRRPCRAASSRRSSREGRAREQHARGRARQGRLRGCGELHAGARLEPGFDELFAGLEPELALRARATRRARRAAARASRRSTRPRARRSAASCARASRRATPSTLGRRHAAAARSMTTCRVLHLQKVAGISGSEAHLLSLLPAAARARLGHPLPDAARARAGRVGVRARADARAACRSTRSRCAPTSTRSRSSALAGYLARHRPTILHTHLVHADVYGQTAGTLARVPVRLTTKHGFNEFREGRLFALADRTIGAPRAPADRDLARARALPRRDRGLRRARASRSSTTGSARSPSRRRTRATRPRSSASAA